VFADGSEGLFEQRCEIGADVADGVRVVAKSNDLLALSASGGTVVSNQQQIGGGKGSKGQLARLVPATADARVAWLFLFVAVVLWRAVRHILTLAQGVCQGEEAVAGNVAGAGKNGLSFIAAVCALPGSFERRIKGKTKCGFGSGEGGYSRNRGCAGH
jgi:hypothetical protein